jgi:hypothetical protein
MYSVTVLNDLRVTGYISSQSNPSVDTVHGYLRYNYSRGQNPEFEEIEPGMFY